MENCVFSFVLHLDGERQWEQTIFQQQLGERYRNHVLLTLIYFVLSTRSTFSLFWDPRGAFLLLKISLGLDESLLYLFSLFRQAKSG